MASAFDVLLRAILPISVRTVRGLRALLSRSGLVLEAGVTRRGSRREFSRLTRRTTRTQPLNPSRPSIELVRLGDATRDTAAANRAASASRSELLCLVSERARPIGETWLDDLAGEVGDDVAAATPMTVHPIRHPLRATPHDARVRSLGLIAGTLRDGSTALVAQFAGDPPDAVPDDPIPVDAAPGAALMVDRPRFLAAGGLHHLASPDATFIDLCLRLRNRGGSIVAVPSSVVVDTGPVVTRRQLSIPLDNTGEALAQVVARHGPSLRRRATGQTRLHMGIAVASPPAVAGARWGDWGFAGGLARSLQRAGIAATVRDRSWIDHPVTRSEDVLLVLRGLTAVRPTPGQRHVIWVISHPDQVTARECDEADLVLASSPRLAEHLRALSATPVEVLLQATDHRRFRPVPADPRHRHAVTIVANTRGVYRRCVRDALAAGLRPAVYGRGWEGMIDRDLIAARHVPNEKLAVVYASAGVVLNDHWDEMRGWGMISNRIFDAAACGTMVVSDALPEIDEMFSGTVATYDTSDELATMIDRLLGDPAGTQDLAGAARERVLAGHTFDHRARQLVDILQKHGLDTPPLA